MILRTIVRDCLLLNWAVPTEALPPLPLPLRYEIHAIDGESRVLVTALFLFHEGVRLAAVPMVRFSYPQFSFALSVLDGDGVPSMLLRRVLVPTWVFPAAKLLGREPVATARLAFDRPSADLGAESWSWTVEDGARLRVEACQGPPAEASRNGDFFQQVEYFRRRRRSYFRTGKGFRRVATEIPEVDPWPMSARVAEGALLEACLPLGGSPWPQVESAFLFPDLPLRYDLSLKPRLRLQPGVPQPAASRRQGLEHCSRRAE
ncbi:MAG: DUF2071 domain-containing protein [Acidobacteriota bacterium]|nr:DUF2071 domain-containing protein [Acidobacteriota bacterium]